MTNADIFAAGTISFLMFIVGVVGGFAAGYLTPRQWDRPAKFSVNSDRGNEQAEMDGSLIPVRFQGLVLVVASMLFGGTLLLAALGAAILL